MENPDIFGITESDLNPTQTQEIVHGKPKPNQTQLLLYPNPSLSLEPRKTKRRHERNNKHREQKRWVFLCSQKFPL